MKDYFVYIMTNHTQTTLYVGVTGNLERRVLEHKQKAIKGFTSKYNTQILVYYEQGNSPYEAIVREKQIKKWKRAWKDRLIFRMNPEWKDLSNGWYDDGQLNN